ncbi:MULTISPECIES: type VI secretion system baseplate subunit TssK [Lysobacter]|uniref:Type VI secretion system baseplate subunit TssK n=1 Tax=Lysobacter firmicutimachus TaxID=1792846 RepID=A0ABU8D2A1_9GAMM|nr:type VI secretion system baseplate subunit TssK [Lysobacter antibioticus]
MTSSESPIRDAHLARSKVVWSEGMYLRPQHFQQQERYLESYVQQRCLGQQACFWGYCDYDIDRDALSLGKIVLASARGVMPDGTPFQFAGGREAPPPLDVPPGCRDEPIVLALPLQRPGGEDLIHADNEQSLARYTVHACDMADNNAVAFGPASIQVGKPRFRLMPASQLGMEWQSLGLVRVLERRSDNSVRLDPRYIPPMLSANRCAPLAGFVSELHGLLEQRGEAMAHRLSHTGRGGVAEVADFLLLELINRSMADTWHALNLDGLHPERLFRDWLRLAFDLSTYTTAERRPGVRPTYRHDDLSASFEPLMADLRRSLSTVLEQNAIAIELQERAPRVWVAQIPSVELIRTAGFVLAVNASAPAEVVRTRYPAQVKIGPVELLNDLVHLHLPGIGIRSLPVAPRQIPYHAGYHYFELDTGSELWRQMETSAGLALHFAGDLPGLSMECWAIRS